MSRLFHSIILHFDPVFFVFVLFMWSPSYVQRKFCLWLLTWVSSVNVTMKRATRCLHLIRSRTKFQPKWTIIIKHMKKKREHFSLVCSGSLSKGSFRSFNPNQKRSFSITPSWRKTTATYCGLGKLWSFEILSSNGHEICHCHLDSLLF